MTHEEHAGARPTGGARRRWQRARIISASAGALVALVSVLSLWPSAAFAASPYPSPATAEQLAQDLSPTGNPSDYLSWWSAVPGNRTYSTWFWEEIVPHGTSVAYGADVADVLWTRAVPGNWAVQPDIGDWPWPSGGYYTQQLWLHAIPEGWAPVPDMGGWPSETGGYYAQWFWLHAVPDNVAGTGNVGGWSWASGGYYTQWLWLHAIPDNWAFVDDMGGWPWPSGGYYAQWFWLHAAPDGLAPIDDVGGWPWASGGYYAQWLWLHAVPDNWATRGDIGGWPWASGGYYTQWLWLHAVPDNWASTADVGGWPTRAGGYYTQWFWLHAVPDNWAPVRSVGGWPWASGGYYTQWLWLHAVPDNWAPQAKLSLGHVPGPASVSDYAQDGQGYYRWWFWEAAVADGWRAIANIGGWNATSGGYYAQWLWLHAVPDQWASNPFMSIDGVSGRGYYDYVFYNYATVRDFAWRDSLSIAGSQGAGYYDYWYHGWFGDNVAHYQQLLDLAGGHLAGATRAMSADAWYAPDAQAVVLLSFDTEGSEQETCAVVKVLRKHGIAATFYMTGYTAATLTPNWIGCLSDMDIQDHTADHPGNYLVAPLTFLDTYPDADQRREMRDAATQIQAAVPDAAVRSFRTPWCDGSRSVDGSVLRNAAAAGMASDSSVLTIPAYARQAGIVPALGVSTTTLSAFPSPFTVTTTKGQIVELPVTYPSDWTAEAIHGLDNSSAPPAPDAPGYAVTVWEREFDEIYAQHGTMVLLMHPWLQAPDGQTPAGLDALITYMETKPGVAFSTVSDANDRYRAATGLPR